MARTDLDYEDARKLYASEPNGMGVTDAELCGDDEKATLLNTQDKWGKEESMRKDGTVVLQTMLGWGWGCCSQTEVQPVFKDVPTWARKDTGLWWDMKHLGDRGVMSSVDGIVRMR